MPELPTDLSTTRRDLDWLGAGCSKVSERLWQDAFDDRQPRFGRQREQLTDDPCCQQAVRLVEDLALKNILGNQERAQFLTDLADFRNRAIREGLSKQEVAKTCQQIARLLEPQTEFKVEPERCLQLAQQVMHQAADPMSISQGFHSTCNVTAVESRLYRKCPSHAVRLVADVALTGKYADYFTRQIELDDDSLEPDLEARRHPPADGQRSFASQLFQVTAINTYWQRRSEDEKPAPDSTVVYKQLPDFPKLDEKGEMDTGERLINTANDQEVMMGPASKREPVRAPWIETWGLQEVYNRVSGQTECDFVLANYAALPDGPSSADKPGRIPFRSSAELARKLAILQEEGKLPVIIKVNVGNEPLKSDGSGKPFGWHLVTVRSYIPETGRVLMDNQWTRSSHHSITIDELYRCSLAPKQN